jgi:hypothetical protein
LPLVLEYPDERLLRDTIDQQPDNVTARHRLAELLLGTGQCSEALSEAQAGLSYMPDHPGLLGIAVMAAELDGKADLARRYEKVMSVVTDEALRSDPSLASSAHQVRWGRRQTDRIGDEDLTALAAGSTELDTFEIDLTEAEASEQRRLTEEPQTGRGDGESRWPLPRRLRHGRKSASSPQLTVSTPRHTFADLAGMTDLKWRLQGLLGSNQRSTRTGVGVLLFGPTGCGKSFIADAVAGQLGMQIVTLNLHDVVRAGDDQGTVVIRDAFALARKAGPCVLVLEDIDAVTDTHRLHARRVDLLAMRIAIKLDECRADEDLLVIATSSAPWRIDPALRTVGRLDRGVFVPPPDLLGRGRIIVDRLSFLPIAPDVNPGELAVETEGLTARELISMVSAAAEHALCVSKHSGALWAVQQRDLRRAFEQLQAGSRDWFARAHGHLRDGSSDVDPVYDYIRRHVRLT